MFGIGHNGAAENGISQRVNSYIVINKYGIIGKSYDTHKNMDNTAETESRHLYRTIMNHLNMFIVLFVRVIRVIPSPNIHCSCSED